MDREQLKGKQTPGKATLYAEGRVIEVTSDKYVTPLISWMGFDDSSRRQGEHHANAALYAEAHNVANRTGMWPEDLLARIKELEEALRGMVEWFEMKRKSAPVDNARAILNKR